MPLPSPNENVALPPTGTGKWRDHISFWFGIFGTVITSISLVLAFYFYQATKVKPLLTFGVHPLKGELQRPDFDKDLGFIYKGKPIESESITLVQVCVWNAGTRSIRDGDVLDPIHLEMPDGSAILSVRIKKTSRPICGFEFSDKQEDYKSGICHLKWRILEPGDGAVLQIIYAGSASHDPKLEGTVEGQQHGIVVEHYSITRNGNINLYIPYTHLAPVIVLLSVGGVLFFIATRIQTQTEAAKQLAKKKAEAEKHIAELQKTLPRQPISGVLAAVALAFFVGAGVLLYFLSSPTGPPFGW